MRVKEFHRRLRHQLKAPPTVGALMELCESNYSLLSRMAPQLACMAGSHRSVRKLAAPLHLDVLEQTRYTSLVRLTHYFPDEGHCDPDVELRIYHDARQVEVVSLRQSVLPLEGLYDHPGLEQKWRANQFVNRWLLFCLAQGHAFLAQRCADDDASSIALPVVA